MSEEPNVPKFSDRQVWANSADPDQTRGAVCSGSTLFANLCIFWMRYSKEKPPCSNFMVITANFGVYKLLGVLRYIVMVYRSNLAFCTLDEMAGIRG